MSTIAEHDFIHCAHCGKRFATPQHSNQHRVGGRRVGSARYCTPACRQAAYVARRSRLEGSPEPISALPSGSDGSRQPEIPASVTNDAFADFQREVEEERRQYPSRFSDAGERYACGELGYTAQWEPAAPQHRAEMPDIPEFLRRSFA
jgi:hypothetical protein